MSGASICTSELGGVLSAIPELSELLTVDKYANVLSIDVHSDLWEESSTLYPFPVCIGSCNIPIEHTFNSGPECR